MNNRFKTALLLTILTAILLVIGQLVGGVRGLTFALIFATIMNFGSYFWSDKIVLKMYRAKEADKKEYSELYKIMRDVVHLAKLPMPKVYIIPSNNANAFATGRNPKHSAVACTVGILKILNNNELKGVIAHEISHIKNRDTLIQTIAATIAGVIGYVAMMARWSAIFGFGGRDRDGGNIIELLVLAIVMPLSATIIQLAISRSREFLADESAAKILHNGFGLASALEKLEHNTKGNPMKFGSENTSSLFIVNPFRARGFSKLLSTHPSTNERIKKLKEMAH